LQRAIRYRYFVVNRSFFLYLVKEHGQCETAPYRLLVGGGGTVLVQTKAAIINALFVIAILSLTVTFSSIFSEGARTV
jgi:hypothetical protein